MMRAGIMGWIELITGLARKAAEAKFGRLGPLHGRGSRRDWPPPLHRRRRACICSASRRRARRCAHALRRVGDLIRCGRSRVRNGDAMRAKLPDHDGLVERDGVKLHYEVYGDAPDTMLFIPPWSIVHSRVYKAQLPYFSERFRCITYDGRGNGKSDRPGDVAAYTLDNSVADALAVMDATRARQAILVGLSLGGLLACFSRRIILSASRQPSSSVRSRRSGLHPTQCCRSISGRARPLRRLGQVQSRLLAGELS